MLKIVDDDGDEIVVEPQGECVRLQIGNKAVLVNRRDAAALVAWLQEWMYENDYDDDE